MGDRDGFPLNLSEMLAITRGSAYIERTSVASPAGIRATKKAIRRAFEIQLQGLGFTLVEVLSPCPTNLKMSPTEACKWVDTEMVNFFPLGVIKDITTSQETNDAH